MRDYNNIDMEIFRPELMNHLYLPTNQLFCKTMVLYTEKSDS